VRHFTRLCNALVIAALILVAGSARSESLFDSMRQGAAAMPAGGYVFVSADLSDTSLIPLARDAQRAGFTMVVNGFWGDLTETRRRVAQVNQACCGNRGASWQVNPVLFQRYHVTASPTFVLAVGPGSSAADYSKVSGQMSLANALKFFGQRSNVPAVKKLAADVYTRAFATQ
jgi:conjugal transfer pilus assembly protein TrbC